MKKLLAFAILMCVLAISASALEVGVNGNAYGEVRGQDKEAFELKVENKAEIRSGEVSAKVDLNISENSNGTGLRAELSNGKFADVKIMPDRASEIAIARLKLNVCTEESNCTIELKEVGVNGEAKAAYDVNATKYVKVLGLFRAKMNIEAHIDAETGEVLAVKQPWWASISSS